MNIMLRLSSAVLCLLLAACAATPLVRNEPTGEERYKLISGEMDKLVTGGRIANVNWNDDETVLTFTRGEQRLEFDTSTRTLRELPKEEQREAATQPQRRRGPARGRQRDSEASPDGKWIAKCSDWNVVLESTSEGESPIRVTTEGHRKVRFGTASWVYGEELDQNEAMWWTPDSRKLVFYEFDERQVPDHFITAGLTDLHTNVLTEGYPKAGEPNPVANLLIYDLQTGATTRVGSDDRPEWYVFAVRFPPGDSPRELLFNRTNRKQNELEVVAADLETGATRIILTETQSTWQENRPLMRFLDDGRRFIWETERSGFKQYELWNLNGSLINPVTRGEYPVASLVHVDEDEGLLFYSAFSDANPLHAQLHCVNLDGTGQRRLTVESQNHSARPSPKGTWFIVESEAVDMPPTTWLCDRDGQRITALAESETSRFAELNMSMPELFSFKADDGATDLYGVLFKPSNFDPNRKYPLVIDVYGGPQSQAVRPRFVPAMAPCEYGFLIARIDNRGTRNRGKAFESAVYMRLGDVDLKDQVDGVRYLCQRPYVDDSRVGIYGHSYGGYMAALALLKFPDVFHVAVAGGTVSDWRNYDTIYTERYMWIPQENESGYDAGSCLKFANQLKGRLLLLHGMVDDNVHANNAWQLADALQKADKPFEMMFYPNAGHGLGGHASALRWDFLRRHLLN